ncbi:EAL domain-containing protein [Atlantibacter hermannii]|nr:EAL domain-containing protein [Atlantibacter hermannii]NBC99978.1 EAL domain-containing protein [Atlantibacter hermannii]
MLNRINIKRFFVALVLCLLLVPMARYISPKAVIDGQALYLAYLPLSVMVAMPLLFGRHAIAPLIIVLASSYSHRYNVSAFQLSAFLFCFMAPFILCGAICQAFLGRRWRYNLTGKGVGHRILWMGFAAPLISKMLRYVLGHYMTFPAAIEPFFGHSSTMFNIVDAQNTVAAALVFSGMFYYPLRMLLSRAFARAFFRRCIVPVLSRRRRIFTFCWLVVVVALLMICCGPYETDWISGYLVPIVFVLFTIGVFKIGPRLISILWSISAWMLLSWNESFLYGNSAYSLAFVLSVFIAFTVSVLFMTVIFQRNERMKRQYFTLSQIDPLTRMPNLRALEKVIERERTGALCCLRLNNMDFLSRHYGLMMRVHVKQLISNILKPWLQHGEMVFQLPGSDLLIFLKGPEPEARLRHMVDLLGSKRIPWNSVQLDIDYGATWSIIHYHEDELYRVISQLSYLAEQVTVDEPVLPLNQNSKVTISGETTERITLLRQVKQVLEEEKIELYAQPIVDAQGRGYHEILARMHCDDIFLTPDKFIPVVAHFNLSVRFDMQVMKALLKYLRLHLVNGPCPRFSVNLMPLTLMQKGAARQIITLFEEYDVPVSWVIIEVTEEQAFSDSETTTQNITLLRESGFRIAIDDFGTGYANFERLKRLQADIIKIDGCFIKDILTDSLDNMIVKSICELAKAKSLSVVAEYVETEAQRQLLLDLGVNYLQGYLTGRPVPLNTLS